MAAANQRIADLLNKGKAGKDDVLLGDLIGEYFLNDEDLGEGMNSVTNNE